MLEWDKASEQPPGGRRAGERGWEEGFVFQGRFPGPLSQRDKATSVYSQGSCLLGQESVRPFCTLGLQVRLLCDLPNRSSLNSDEDQSEMWESLMEECVPAVRMKLGRRGGGSYF